MLPNPFLLRFVDTFQIDANQGSNML